MRIDREKAAKVKHLQSSFEHGKLSRRSFMQGALALGVSMTSAMSLVNVAQAQTPKKGGRFRIGITGSAGTGITA